MVPVEKLETVPEELLDELHEFEVPVGFDEMFVPEELEEFEPPGVV